MQTNTCRLPCVSRSLYIPILFALICVLSPHAQATPVSGTLITVPPAIYVDATSARGAVVSFTVTATDVIDGTLTPVVTPPSGSLFPIGVTTVQVSTINSGGISSYASFPVTVLAPQQVVINVAFNVYALTLPTTEGKNKVFNAFQLLLNASNGNLWFNNVSPKLNGGSNAFDQASFALNALEDLLHNSDSPLTPSQSVTLNSAISRLVNAYRVVALYAISRAPTDTPQYAAALKDLARGDGVTAAHDPIGHYKDAWQDVVFGPSRQH